ncbi:MAG: cell surface protein [Deltaproteobacteria bacterium]|nr:cell surface protein [Deltaproteobacteria bacterium]
MRSVLVFTALFAAACGAPDPSGAHTAADSGSSTTPQDAGSDFIVEVVAVTYGTNAGFGQDLFPGVVLGPPSGGGTGRGSFDVLSLGNRGSITVRLGRDAVDGPGPDLIVFENAFLLAGQGQTWAEPARVEVSQDGETWHAFPCDSTAWPFTGCAGVIPVQAPGRDGGISPVDPAVSGGDLFDFSDIGVERARFVRITDEAPQDQPAQTAGFDLDAVAVVRHDGP